MERDADGPIEINSLSLDCEVWHLFLMSVCLICLVCFYLVCCCGGGGLARHISRSLYIAYLALESPPRTASPHRYRYHCGPRWCDIDVPHSSLPSIFSLFFSFFLSFSQPVNYIDCGDSLTHTYNCEYHCQAPCCRSLVLLLSQDDRVAINDRYRCARQSGEWYCHSWRR